MINYRSHIDRSSTINQQILKMATRNIITQDVIDPNDFIAKWNGNDKISIKIGGSQMETFCAGHSQMAREEYKKRRSALAPGDIAPTGDGQQRLLTNDQKYLVRLENNKKSAHISKVHKEVYKFKLSKMIHLLEESLLSRQVNGSQHQTITQSSDLITGHLQIEKEHAAVKDEVNQLMGSVNQLNAKISELKERTEQIIGEHTKESNEMMMEENRISGLGENNINSDYLFDESVDMHGLSDEIHKSPIPTLSTDEDVIMTADQVI